MVANHFARSFVVSDNLRLNFNYNYRRDWIQPGSAGTAGR